VTVSVDIEKALAGNLGGAFVFVRFVKIDPTFRFYSQISCPEFPEIYKF
jgi:hypothetical protein